MGGVFNRPTQLENVMTEETINQSPAPKQALLLEFFKKYGDIVEFVNSLQIHQQFKLNAITRLDECMFWTREAISNMGMPVKPVEAANVAVGEPNPAEDIAVGEPNPS